MDQIVAMGFEESEARRALDAASGNVEHALNILLSGGEEAAGQVGGAAGGENIVRLEVNQYTFEQGSSACTPIACTLVTAILQSLRAGNKTYEQPGDLTDLVVEGVQSYLAAVGDSVQHLSAEELYNMSDRMKEQLSLVGPPHQGMVTTPNVFQSLIEDVRSSPNLISRDEHVGVILTKPPETVGFVVPPEGKDWEFVFFDSHARPQYGFTGAYLVRGETPDTITSRLYGLFESDLGEEMGADVMTSTYNMFEATVFQLSPEATSAASGAAGATSQVAEGKTQESAAAAPGSSTQDQGSAKAEHAPEAKPATEGASAPAKKSSRNPGIGMGMRIRRDHAPREVQSSVDAPERTLIDRWIQANNLNQFGDPRGVMYAGGTPLFDERTATSRERYEYIVSRHPGRPWAS